jgi:N-acetylneuraminic acid mutarotase
MNQFILLSLLCIFGVLVQRDECTSVNTWSDVDLDENFPNALDGSSALFIAPWIYTFYGFNETIIGVGVGQSSNEFYDTIHVIHPQSGQTFQLNVSGDVPSVRAYPSVIYNMDHARPAVYLWAGTFYDFVSSPPFLGYYNDMYKLDMRTSSWTELNPHNNPTARVLCATAQMGNKMIIHGGLRLNIATFTAENFGDMHIYDTLTNSFTQLDQFNDVPSPRHNHHMHYWENFHKLIMYGGTYASGFSSYIYHTDFYEYDLNTNSWEAHNVSLNAAFGITNLKQPTSRILGNKFILQGGDGASGNPVMNENTIIYDLITRELSIVSTSGPALKRAFSVADVDQNFATFHVGGGYDYNATQIRTSKLYSYTIALN